MPQQEQNQLSLLGKYIIRGHIYVLTGLHIGKQPEGVEIGGVDNPVIIDPLTRYPIIPGSSLKGKIRSLLEWMEKMHKKDGENISCVQNNIKLSEQKEKKEDKEKIKNQPCEDPDCDIAITFGLPAEIQNKNGPTRVIFRDAFPTEETIKRLGDLLGEDVFTELKTENTIGRISGQANPRRMERVPAGTVFDLEIIFDVYEEKDKERIKLLFKGLKYLEKSYLGGSGTRGYGRVAFEIKEIKKFPENAGLDDLKIGKKPQNILQAIQDGKFEDVGKLLEGHLDSITLKK